MKFKYVGKKDRETAFSEATGIVWEPGAEHDIADKAIAKRMLAHPDVFEPVALAEKQAAAPAEGAGLSTIVTTGATEPAAITSGTQEQAAKPQQDPENPPAGELVMMTKAGPLNLSTLDKAQLHQLAKDEGLDIHPNAKAETVAKRLAETFPVPAATTAAEGAE